MSNDKSRSSTDDGLKYIQYDANKEEVYLDPIRQLIAKDLSGGRIHTVGIEYQLTCPEPYSIYVYRYFLYQWGHLCYMVYHLSFQGCTPDISVNLFLGSGCRNR
jgi:hypothetical protein